MKIQVLGPGCRSCEQLFENAVSAASELVSKHHIDVEKITDINEFARMGVFMTPGLVIDDEVIAVGKVLSVDDVKKIIEKRV
jgi:small redox-active disulfide protein 2